MLGDVSSGAQKTEWSHSCSHRCHDGKERRCHGTQKHAAKSRSFWKAQYSLSPQNGQLMHMM